MIHLLLFIGCFSTPNQLDTTEDDVIEVESNPDACQSRGLFYIGLDEKPDGWIVSIEELISIINEYDTCIWEEDGSTTKIHSEIRSEKIEVWEQKNSLNKEECIQYLDFDLLIDFYNQNGDFVWDGSLPISLIDESLGNIEEVGYQHIDFPPSEFPLGNEAFFVYFSAYGAYLPQGEIHQVSLEITMCQDSCHLIKNRRHNVQKPLFRII